MSQIAQHIELRVEPDLPVLDVSRREFGRIAFAAGWEPATVMLFLDAPGPVREPVQVGGQKLRVCDWK